AIVWQDRRTSDYCDQLKEEGYTDMIQEKTGLIIDSYFSGTKIKWILDHVNERAKRPKRENWPSVPLTAGLSGISLRAICTSPMSQMHPVPCFTISEGKSGIKSCWSCWIFPGNCFQKCATPARCTAPPKPLFSLMKYPLRVLPAISRRPCLDRCACNRACLRIPTAQDHSSYSTPAMNPLFPKTIY